MDKSKKKPCCPHDHGGETTFVRMTPKQYLEYVAKGIIYKSPFHETFVQLANVSKKEDDAQLYMSVEKCPSSNNE